MIIVNYEQYDDKPTIIEKLHFLSLQLSYYLINIKMQFPSNYEEFYEEFAKFPLLSLQSLDW